MTLKQKIANGLACAGLAAVLTGGAIDIYNMEQVKDSVAERLDLDEGEKVYSKMIDQFPELRKQYNDKTGTCYFMIPGVVLAGIGIAGGPFRGVPGWASSSKKEED
ncbi:MAG: hypothetical protein ABH824_05950 [Nanoarchaeota archaeon]